MPEFDDRAPLDERLARGRSELLGEITQPPLAAIRDRAARRRGRRRGTAGAAGLAVAVLATALVVRPPAGPEPTAVPPAAVTTPSAPVYTAAGITLNGLTEAGAAQIEGTIQDVEFTDPDHGYVLAGCVDAPSCPASLARTEDGGLSWQVTELPADTRGRADLDLIAFPEGRLAVTGGTTHLSTDAGRGFRNGPPGGRPAAPTPARPDDRLRLRPGDPGAARCGATVEIWRAEPLGPAGRLDTGDVDVCWAATVPAPDGGWWIGGTRDGAAVVAKTLDGGATWSPVRLDVPADAVGSVQVAALGGTVYAVVSGPDQTVLGVYRSTDRGHTFTRTAARPGGLPRLSGMLVPLLDGRLLAAGTDRHWYVSADGGATFTRADGSLPAVGRISRTTAGWVAYGLFGANWAAYSTDAATWRKLQLT